MKYNDSNMAKIRTIKPEFWEDEKIARLPMPCRLFYIGTWTFADGYGVIKGNPSFLRSQIFPYDEDMKLSTVKSYIDSLVTSGMLIPFTYSDESYYLIRSFRKHQVIDKRYERSQLTRDADVAKSLIDNILQNSGKNPQERTTCTHSEHIVNTTCTPREHYESTTAEMEMEMEMDNIPLYSVPLTGSTAPSKKKQFVKPTLEEVRAYIHIKNYTFDAEAFLAYYESNGWKVGRNPMKSWQAACSTWQKRETPKNKTYVTAEQQAREAEQRKRVDTVVAAATEADINYRKWKESQGS